MRKLGIGMCLLIAMFMDTVLFSKFNVIGAVPDCVLVVTVCMGILSGPSVGALMGVAAGLVQDVLVGRAIGISAMAYMLSGVVGGIFYKKYYADNIIIPMITAAVCAFFKEHVMVLMTRLVGGNFQYFEMLVTYIIPCALISAALCAPVHLFLKPRVLMNERKRYDRSAGGVK